MSYPGPAWGPPLCKTAKETKKIKNPNQRVGGQGELGMFTLRMREKNRNKLLNDAEIKASGGQCLRTSHAYLTRVPLI